MMIPLDEPVFNGNEKKYVNDCLKWMDILARKIC